MMHSLPTLPLEPWEKTKKTLHLYFQVVGKIALKLNPSRNHWWHITLHVTATGLTTASMPMDDSGRLFEINFDFIQHQLQVRTCDGDNRGFDLKDGLSVASFKKQLFGILDELKVKVKIVDKPYDLEPEKSFDQIEEFHFYNKESVEKYWAVLRWVDKVFIEFSAGFYGKQCPVHLYWHHMDLAVTRFSGKKGPEMDPSAKASDKDAYSHEVISFGFWAGDDIVREPAFYSYTYPSPKGIDEEPLAPDYASWVDSNGSPMAFLSYNLLQKEANPNDVLLSFLNSAYQAGAKRAGWDIASFTYKPF
ncbi:DUF5996 family protein [Echinicola shivajiensis]|uniref:DUF5996 family protein n=1 Tax=Echinicola shivajiensis TaxID=1035916 RepID=UPI001BFCAA14|nr:DUF5996 family protein [Echinicola shivajiensis]